MDQPTAISLLKKHFAGVLDTDEQQQLLTWLKVVEADEFNSVMDAVGADIPAQYASPYLMSEEFARRLEQRVDEMESDEREVAGVPVRRIPFLKTAWFKYAAAIIIVAGVGSYLWNTQQKERTSVTTSYSEALAREDVAPGGNRATLTLADGSKIMLDSAANGTIARDGEATISKEDGRIIYSSHVSRLTSHVLYNTMTTPRGGQYQLALPDGTRVWLNAASSITYPTSFTGTTREVSVKGEAYFEVAKDKKRNFLVKTPTDDIRVMGTHFNVNAYADEPSVKTTLLEGSVMINNQMLSPGEAYLDGKIIKADVEQDVAWKNGLFNFNDRTFEEVMRQLARWYDIEVVYAGEIPKKEYGGELKRNLNLSQILEVLESSKIHFELKGRHLTIKP